MLKFSPWLIYMVCIREGDEWKNVFWTYYGHFEYVVMSFGLTNVLDIFQHLMNNVLYESLDDFMVFYIDDILIFSKKIEEHEQHVSLVLDKFRKVGFYIKLKKCKLLKSNSLCRLSMKMVFTWILIRSKPLWIGLPQLLFTMFNVFNVQLHMQLSYYYVKLMQLVCNYHGDIMLMLPFIDPSRFDMWYYENFWVRVILK